MESCRWVGCSITIDCGDSLGIFQGQVSSVDSKQQTISLVKAFRNGLPCQVPEITISSCDIQNLEILKIPIELEVPDISKVPRGVCQDVCPTENVDHFSNSCQSPVKNGGESRTRTSSVSEMRRKPGTPRKSDSRRRWQDKDDDCLTTPICSDIFETEFDFEKNLALFDKQAVFEEIDAATKPDVVRLVDIQQTPKYRCEEHVLEHQPIVHRQIKVPHAGTREFVTDSGLIVPSISLSLREKLFSTAANLGFIFERQIELFGRAASDMILQLLGGSHRLNPRNSHQIPSVVLLCGPCSQGMQALSCGRHLATHEVNVTAYVPAPTTQFSSQMNMELALYKLNNGKIASSVSELPTGTTDVIVCALDGHEAKQDGRQKSSWYTDTISWVSHCKAPILTLDPPIDGVIVNTKWSLVPVLPLDLHLFSAGNVYLCDLAIPKTIFSEVGITYQSPFGPKCVIPLHVSNG